MTLPRSSPPSSTHRTLAYASHSARTAGGAEVRLSEVVAALSYALDLTEGQPVGHSVRTCLIGMRIAQAIQLNEAERAGLFYGLLLKDLGCSSNAARLASLFGADDRALKADHKLIDWSNTVEAAKYVFRHLRSGSSAVVRAWHTVKLGMATEDTGREMIQTRCDRGADIAHLLGLETSTAEAIRGLDEHWDGRGLPVGLKGDQIPLLARIASLAQTVEVFAAQRSVDAAYAIVRKRRGTWFDPALVDAMQEFRWDQAFWTELWAPEARRNAAALEPEARVIAADEARLDLIAEAFARVIDAKSPYTHQHSAGVARIAVGIGETIGLTPADLVTIRRAGLLHDIGKLGVSNTILDKPGPLTDDEVAVMREHTRYTLEILTRVQPFRAFADIAASHHERLDGRGYHRGLPGDQLGQLARVLAVADVSEALSAKRPYRDGMPLDRVLGILRKDAGTALCDEAVAGAEQWLRSGGELQPRAVAPASGATADQY